MEDRPEDGVRKVVPGLEKKGHRYSGWPGAWCLDCGSEDPNELCLALHVTCKECMDRFTPDALGWAPLNTAALCHEFPAEVYECPYLGTLTRVRYSVYGPDPNGETEPPLDSPADTG